MTPEPTHPDHVCACQGCDPDLLGQGEQRTGEHHLSVRFPGDEQRKVYLNGEQDMSTFEAWAGNPGTILRLRLPVHMCRTCHQDPCAERVVGDVAVSGPVLLAD